MILDSRIAILDLMRKTSASRAAEKKLPSFVSRQVATSQRYFVDLLPDRSQALAVACGGYEHVRKDYGISRTDFPYFCIEFVCAGKGKVWFGESADNAEPQEAVPIQAEALKWIPKIVTVDLNKTL